MPGRVNRGRAESPVSREVGSARLPAVGPEVDPLPVGENALGAQELELAMHQMRSRDTARPEHAMPGQIGAVLRQHPPDEARGRGPRDGCDVSVRGHRAARDARHDVANPFVHRLVHGDRA